MRLTLALVMLLYIEIQAMLYINAPNISPSHVTVH
jgi:hypothetical protein